MADGDIVGRDKITSTGGSKGSIDVNELIAEKLRNKAREDAAEVAAKEAAAEAIRSGRSGNISIDSGGIRGNIGNVGGSVAGGDMIVGGDMTSSQTITTTTNTNTVSGLSADDVAKLFDRLYQKIGTKPQEDQPAIKDAVDTLKQAAQAEAVEGKVPDEKVVTAAAKSLAVDAPDLLTDAADVALATLENPAKGVITIIRKIAEKAKASRGG